MTRVLVTGGAGFIGSHLADRLIAAGEQVVALDDLSTGSHRNIEHLVGHPGFRFVPGSVLDPDLVNDQVRRADVVVHFAAGVGVKLVLDEPLRSLRTNVIGAETVLEAAARHRRQTLIASTSEVYGRNASTAREDDDSVFGSTAALRWGYALAKAVDEALAFAYHRDAGLPVTVVRFFNTVGPRQVGTYGMVLPRLARQAVRGEPLTVYGDGLQSRVFCHVRDAVRAVDLLLRTPAARGRVFNVGGVEETTILGLAQRVARIADSSSPVVLVPYAEAYGDGFEDVRRRVPDCGRIRAAVGWEPDVSLDELIAEVVAEAREAIAREPATPGPARSAVEEAG